MTSTATVPTVDSMVRWQYRIVHLGAYAAGERLGMALSYFGQRGWELQAVYDKASNWLGGLESGFMMFKRPVPAGEEPDGAWSEVWNSEQVMANYRQS